MKKLIVFFGLIGCMLSTYAHDSHLAPFRTGGGKLSPVRKVIVNNPAQPKDQFGCTITLTATIGAGGSSIQASCSTTESTCDLATQSAASCLNSVVRYIRAQLK